jgi:hypothetical protein
MLRIEVVSESTISEWQNVHNRVIPDAPLTVEEIRERLGRSFLTVACAGNDVNGCTTVRHADDEGNMTVIARAIAEYRRRGYGEKLYRRDEDRPKLRCESHRGRRSGVQQGRHAVRGGAWLHRDESVSDARPRGFVHRNATQVAKGQFGGTSIGVAREASGND